MNDTLSAISAATELIKSSNYDEAIIQLKILAKKEPENEIILGMLASVYSEIKLFSKASDLYEKILDINSNNPLARFQLGMNYYQSNDFEKALQIWEPSLLDNTDFMSRFFSGLALLQLDKPEEARELLTQAREITPEDHPVYEQLMTLLEVKDPLH